MGSVIEGKKTEGTKENTKNQKKAHSDDSNESKPAQSSRINKMSEKNGASSRYKATGEPNNTKERPVPQMHQGYDPWLVKGLSIALADVIDYQSLVVAWVHEVIEKVEYLEEYKQLASYVWRGTEKQPVLVVPGTPPVLVRWTGGVLQRDEKDMKEKERNIRGLKCDRIMSPQCPIEPVLRALIVCPLLPS